MSATPWPHRSQSATDRAFFSTTGIAGELTVPLWKRRCRRIVGGGEEVEAEEEEEEQEEEVLFVKSTRRRPCLLSFSVSLLPFPNKTRTM